jgi:hypothetical protein
MAAMALVEQVIVYKNGTPAHCFSEGTTESVHVPTRRRGKVNQ